MRPQTLSVDEEETRMSRWVRERRRLVATPLLVVTLVLASLSALATSAQADLPVLTGVVTDGVNPVAGAFVAVTGAEGQATAVTDADGHYSVDQLPEGDYTVAVQASGFTVGTEAVAVAGNAAVDASFALRSSGATFSSLPFYGGQIEHLFSGGVPGLFYAATGAIPQIFRTVDYGGHWTPVSTQYDDPANGLDKWTLQPGNRVAVSGHPGEIAVRMNASVYYSRDFGATWQALPEQFPLNGSGPHEVFWGHAGDSSVLLVRDGTQSWRADMTQASPHLVRMTAGYGASTDVVTVADGVGAPWVAALSTSGTLTIYRLTADEPATPEGSPLTGFPNGSNLLVLSGTSTAQTPPSAVFTHGSGGDVVIALKDAEDSVFTAARRSAPYPMPSECAAGTGSFIAPASLAPTSGGARAFGTMGFCAVQDAAGTLTARQMWGGANNIAYDAGYGVDGDLVILANGNRGIAKSASVDGHGVPIFPSDQDATAGAGPNSGGDSVDGINVPVVADTAYGPSADNIATVLAAGGLGYASDDGGRTSHIAVRSGGSAVAWWQGATHSWLMFGTGGQGTLLTAIPDWSASSPTLDQPNLVDVQASDLGFPDPDRNGLSITALAGIPDSDTVFVGVGKGGDWSPEEEATSGALARVTLTAVPRAFGQRRDAAGRNRLRPCGSSLARILPVDRGGSAGHPVRGSGQAHVRWSGHGHFGIRRHAAGWPPGRHAIPRAQVGGRLRCRHRMGGHRLSAGERRRWRRRAAALGGRGVELRGGAGHLRQPGQPDHPAFHGSGAQRGRPIRAAAVGEHGGLPAALHRFGGELDRAEQPGRGRAQFLHPGHPRPRDAAGGAAVRARRLAPSVGGHCRLSGLEPGGHRLRRILGGTLDQLHRRVPRQQRRRRLDDSGAGARHWRQRVPTRAGCGRERRHDGCVPRCRWVVRQRQAVWRRVGPAAQARRHWQPRRHSGAPRRPRRHALPGVRAIRVERRRLCCGQASGRRVDTAGPPIDRGR
jgi:hypothetical protein